MLLAARTKKQNKQIGGEKKFPTRELVWKKGKSVTWARKSNTSKCEQMVGR